MRLEDITCVGAPVAVPTEEGIAAVESSIGTRRVYVLPRDEEDIFVAGTGLLEALDWLCSSGKLTKPSAERDFEPLDSR